MTDKEGGKPKPQHKATYSADKMKGGYNIRVVGPHANVFAGREIPVDRTDGTTNLETLVKVLHSGVDDGSVIAANQGKPYALYSFDQKPRDKKDEIPF